MAHEQRVQDVEAPRFPVGRAPEVAASNAGKGEVILGKQRHGPTGSVPVAWDGALTKFSNLARGHQ